MKRKTPSIIAERDSNPFVKRVQEFEQLNREEIEQLRINLWRLKDAGIPSVSVPIELFRDMIITMQNQDNKIKELVKSVSDASWEAENRRNQSYIDYQGWIPGTYMNGQ